MVYGILKVILGAVIVSTGLWMGHCVQDASGMIPTHADPVWETVVPWLHIVVAMPAVLLGMVLVAMGMTQAYKSA